MLHVVADDADFEDSSDLMVLSHCCQSRAIRYFETVFERSRKNKFWSIQNSGEVFSKLKSRGFRATSLCTNDFFYNFYHINR